MSSTTAADVTMLTVTIKAPSDSKVSIQVPSTATVLEFKNLIFEQSPEDKRVPVANQRLIFSGRVLKDEDDLVARYKLKSGDTVHLVKGASAAPIPSTHQVPAEFGVGSSGNQVMGNPLAPLLAAQNAGALANFNPFAEMGINTNDPNYMATMMNSPEAQASIASALNNPAVIDQLIAANPELQRMGPQVREIMQSEQFRSMLSNPEAMRSMMQMQQAMRGGGGMGGMGGMFGGAGGAPAAAAAQGDATPSALFNPWASNPATAAPTGAGAQAGLGGAGMEEFARMMAGMQGGGGFGGMGMGGAPAVPTGPVISPEERFETQLTQLQEMGFYDTPRNIRALMATGGNTQAAIEYLFSMP